MPSELWWGAVGCWAGGEKEWVGDKLPCKELSIQKTVSSAMASAHLGEVGMWGRITGWFGMVQRHMSPDPQGSTGSIRTCVHLLCYKRGNQVEMLRAHSWVPGGQNCQNPTENECLFPSARCQPLVCASQVSSKRGVCQPPWSIPWPVKFKTWFPILSFTFWIWWEFITFKVFMDMINILERLESREL